MSKSNNDIVDTDSTDCPLKQTNMMFHCQRISVWMIAFFWNQTLTDTSSYRAELDIRFVNNAVSITQKEMISVKGLQNLERYRFEPLAALSQFQMDKELAFGSETVLFFAGFRSYWPMGSGGGGAAIVALCRLMLMTCTN